MIDADLLERYGVDVTDPRIRRKPWFWLRSLTQQLLTVPPTLTLSLAGDQVLTPNTRLGYAVKPATVYPAENREE
jgi:hypothetical protein